MSNEVPQQTLKQPVQPPMQIELQNVKKVYPVTGGEVVALDNISLKIRKGDIFGIIGLSGAGKSTLIRCVNRLDTPTEGKILIDGQNVPDMNKQQLRQMRRKVSMIFQQFNLLMQQTVAKNIAYPMECIGVPRAKINARVKELLEVVGLESKAKAYPAQLSGGQRQRVAIGRAIVRDPKVFLMDEPLSNLDAKLRNQMRAEIIKLREKIDTTFLYVTHDQVEAMTLGDRIVIMRDGFIQQIGTPQEVFNHPTNLFVAGFIGTPQMNFFEDCRLTKNGDAYSVTVMGHTLPLTAEQNAKLAAAGAESRTVTVGVRPVHVTVGDEGIDAQIDVSELMGSELHLHMTAGGKDVVAVVQTANLDPNAYARHTAVRFSFEPRLIHLFDPETEKNLI